MRSYKQRVEILAKKLGSIRAVARALGVTHNAVQHRLANPDVVKLEHELALEAVEARVGGHVFRWNSARTCINEIDDYLEYTYRGAFSIDDVRNRVLKHIDEHTERLRSITR